MNGLARRAVLGTIAVAVLRAASVLGDSSCLSAKSAEDCRSQIEEGTGDQCVWCSCLAIPSECLGASLAKKLPKAVFTCDDAGAPAAAAGDQTLLMFDFWKEKYGVSYAHEEEEAWHLNAFKENLDVIRAHRQQFLGRPEPYSVGLNRFSDMTWDTFHATHLGFYGGASALGESQNCSATHEGSQYRALGLSTGRSPPPARDWRDLGAVSPVKDQGQCGSCWTFSTTGCLESHHYLRTGEMVLLSEQQLVDCAGAYDNHGCNGGLPSHAFEYIADAGGLDTEDAYPYLAEGSGSCAFAERGVGADVIRSVNITFQDEAELMEAVGNTGPVSVAFQVAPDFKAYAGGVYDNPGCSTLPEQVNHAVLAVGYDTTPEGVDYWIIKNSWGPEWGLDGFFHMARGKNMCGVADCAAFPFVP
eukprot:jgi/Undpi1/11275/HiC_scaffold_30.g13573.m1